MVCPKCGKDTAILVTAEQKVNVRERSGIVWKIIFFPFTFLWWLFKVCFVGRKQKYYREQHWHCNYCNHDWPQEEVQA